MINLKPRALASRGSFNPEKLAEIIEAQGVQEADRLHPLGSIKRAKEIKPICTAAPKPSQG